MFRALASTDNPPLPEPDWSDAEGLLRWLADTRNDLEHAAMALVPEVGTVLDALGATDGCRLARMSGSGGTCLGVFTEAEAARAAARHLQEAHRHWWVEAAAVLTRAP